MFSLAAQSGFNNVFTHSSLPCQTLGCRARKTSIFMNHRTSLTDSPNVFDKKIRPISRNQRFTSFAAVEALAEESPTEAPPETGADDENIAVGESKRVEVVVKQAEKPRLVLKFKWMEKSIGLALDQVIAGHGTIPLSPYFFWPRKDAWEELKAVLESKSWISQNKMVILLNQATDIINLWQQSGGNFTTQ